jgi:hypothetical protein
MKRILRLCQFETPLDTKFPRNEKIGRGVWIFSKTLFFLVNTIHNRFKLTLGNLLCVWLEPRAKHAENFEDCVKNDIPWPLKYRSLKTQIFQLFPHPNLGQSPTFLSFSKHCHKLWFSKSSLTRERITCRVLTVSYNVWFVTFSICRWLTTSPLRTCFTTHSKKKVVHALFEKVLSVVSECAPARKFHHPPIVLDFGVRHMLKTNGR